jgi:hypothetical protein
MKYPKLFIWFIIISKYFPEYLRFEFLTAVMMSIVILWVVTCAVF